MTRKVKNPGRGYSGLEKKPLYLYDNKGSFIKKYESQIEFRKEYYPNDIHKRPIIDTEKSPRAQYGYALNSDKTYIADYKIGRDNLLKYEAIVNCIFCKNIKTDKTIIAYNMLGEEVARFKSLNIAARLTNIDKGTIHGQCASGLDRKIRTKTGLRFKYETYQKYILNQEK